MTGMVDGRQRGRACSQESRVRNGAELNVLVQPERKFASTRIRRHVTILLCVLLHHSEMRQSVAPSRVSHAHALSSQANNPASVHRLLEKKKEYEAVAALERASALFVKRIEGLADDCEVMADAGQGKPVHMWKHTSPF